MEVAIEYPKVRERMCSSAERSAATWRLELVLQRLVEAIGWGQGPLMVEGGLLKT
jgi:hypothetical protein